MLYEKLWLIVTLLSLSCVWKASSSSQEDRLRQLEKEVEVLKSVVNSLSRQVMLQSMYHEESLRGVGHSGIKQIRLRDHGTQSYYTDSHVGRSQASIHDHIQYKNTCGLGEMSAVLNGVEFRTRHNDYMLVAPHSKLHGGTEKGFHAVETIEFPKYESRNTLEHQIKDLKLFFKSWKESDYKKYRKYFYNKFKPLLCYLEGAWLADANTFGESFTSLRHKLDAYSWENMQDKVRFTSYSGRKNNKENVAALPKTIVNFVDRYNISVPVYAQWNYRILCHKLKAKLALKSLRPVDDFSNRMAYETKYENFTSTRQFRYRLMNRGNLDKRWYMKDFLDRLMSEIPGKDNYPGKSTDNAFGNPAMETSSKSKGPINVSYYHRWYKSASKGAMGGLVHHRGYNDEFMFAAMTNSTKIAPMSFTECKKVRRNKKWENVCSTYTQRWSFAIPLEIVYVTPLQTWNPYNIHYQGEGYYANMKVTQHGKRNGGFTPETAYNGSSSGLYYTIPEEFFKTTASGTDPADSGSKVKGVLDSKGVVRRVLPGGFRTLLPEIEGVGRLRTRYPIFPVYEEGSLAYKETKALQNLLMNPKRYKEMYRKFMY